MKSVTNLRAAIADRYLYRADLPPNDVLCNQTLWTDRTKTASITMRGRRLLSADGNSADGLVRQLSAQVLSHL